MNFGRLSVRRGEHSAVGCEAHEAAKVIHVEPNETHSIPPWWVVAGVKPEGPETDYGAYRTAGFSKSQQEQPLDQMKGLKSLVQVRSRRDRACAASWAALDRGPYPGAHEELASLHSGDAVPAALHRSAPWCAAAEITAM